MIQKEEHILGKFLSTRNKLLEATIKEYRKRGYKNTTIKNVSIRSKIVESKFYSCFDNKNELVHEATRVVSQNFDKYIKESLYVTDPQNSYQAMVSFGEAAVVWSVNESNLAELLSHKINSNTVSSNENSKDCYLFTYIENADNILVDFIEDYNPKINKEELSIQYWSLIQGYARMVMNGDCNYERETIENFVSIWSGLQGRLCQIGAKL